MSIRLKDVILRDTRAAQPAANTVPAGTIYYVTDEGVTERSTASAWEDISDAATLADGDYGDITVGSSGTTLTIDDEAVTYAKMQHVSAASRLLGRGSAAGAGDVQELTLGTGLSLTGTELTASITSDTDLSLEEGQLNTAFYDIPGVGEGHIFVTIDGGGSAITTGVKGDLYLPFPIKLLWVAILADQSSSSIVIDVWHVAGLGAIPTDSNSITASDPPTLTNGVDSIDTNIATWTVDLDPGRMRFNVDSITTTTRAQLILGFQRRDIP